MSKDTFPDFLSKDFFATAIGHDIHFEATALKITDIRLSAATKEGENFCSDIYRAEVIYHLLDNVTDPTAVSLIVKAMPFHPKLSQLREDQQVFEKEVNMYNETLPRLSQLLGGRKLCPK